MRTWSEAMNQEGWMIHLPPEISAEEYDALPEEVARRIEVVDGRIIVSPSPTRIHQRLNRRLADALESLCPVDLQLDYDIAIRLADVRLHVRCPDIVIYRADLDEGATLRPEHVTLAVEIVSPGSVITDRVDKPAEFAAAGIPHYWRVELDSLEVHTHAVPTNRGYRQLDMHRARLVTDRPFPVDVDLAALLRR